MVAATHCLTIVALVLTLVAWITAIIGFAVPEWYVINSASDGKTRLGPFKFCSPTTATGPETCETLTSHDFTFSQCDRTSTKVNERFMVVQGLGIAGIIVAVLATAALFASVVIGCRSRRRQHHRRLRQQAIADANNAERQNESPNEPHRHPNDSTNTEDHIADEADDENDETDDGHRSRVPKLEIIAACLSAVSVALFIASCFYFLQSVQSWLFCDQQPCAYLQANSVGTTGCKDGMGWALALAIIAWIAGIMVIVALVFRWCMRPPTPPGVGEDGANEMDEQYDSQTNNAAAIDATPREIGFNKNHNNRRGGSASPYAPTTLNSANPMDSVENNNVLDDPTNGRDTLDSTQREYQQQQNDTTKSQAVAASTPPAAKAQPSARVRQPGEPADAELPDGDWVWDNASQLYWSEEQQYFFDHNSGHYYAPDSGQWYDPVAQTWYTL